MSHSPFFTPFEELPETLPVFPLGGAIIMPGGDLPLNIFEPRYLNMVSDALASHRMIGMIQPNPDSGNETDLCRTGCAGRITRYHETGDGRIEMILSGVCRFDRGQELPTTRGYRLIVPDWSRFKGDYANHENLLRGQREQLIRRLKHYFDMQGLATDWSLLERLSPVTLIDKLSMALPLSERDKQLLLESVEPVERLHTFTALLGSGFPVSGSSTRH